MKKYLIIIISVMFITQVIIAENTYQNNFDKYLYIYNPGGHSPSGGSSPSGNITTISPKSSNDELESFNPKSIPPHEHSYWYSDPIHLGFQITGDIQIKIWAKSAESRSVSFMLSLERYNTDGTNGTGSGYGTSTESKIVDEEPVEFDVIIPADSLSYELTKFNKGDRIGIGISAFYETPQPPSEIYVLFNSVNHPSHLKISTSFISVDYINPIISNNRAYLNVNITDTFGINDIVDYDIVIIDSSNDVVEHSNTLCNEVFQIGILALSISWDHLNNDNHYYTINIMISDSNNNKMKAQETLSFEIKEDYPLNDQNNDNKHDNNLNDLPDQESNENPTNFFENIGLLLIIILTVCVILIITYRLKNK